jgi:hypothetical protein
MADSSINKEHGNRTTKDPTECYSYAIANSQTSIDNFRIYLRFGYAIRVTVYMKLIYYIMLFLLLNYTFPRHTYVCMCSWPHTCVCVVFVCDCVFVIFPPPNGVVFRHVYLLS